MSLETKSMTQWQARSAHALVALFAVLALNGCGGGGGDSSPPPVGGTPTPTPSPSPSPSPTPSPTASPTPPPTDSNPIDALSGVVRAANGDPIPFAAIFVLPPQPNVQSAKYMAADMALRTKAIGGTDCLDNAPANALAKTCTDANGAFSLDVAAIKTLITRFEVKKGALAASVQVPASCTTATCALPAAATTLTQSNAQFPKVGVVTGAFDNIESVLAKLGDADLNDSASGVYGRVDASGRFIAGSEAGTRLTIITGSGPVPAGGSSWDAYLNGTAPLVDQAGVPVFDIIFINCGNDYETLLADAAVRGRLKAYVEAGGKLYVTDLSYNFIEQVFPEFALFEGDPDSPTTPGAGGAADQGREGISVEGVIGLPGLSDFLQKVSVNSNDGATAGNPNTCPGSTYPQVVGGLVGGRVPLGDFLNGWSQVKSTHDAQTVVVISGAVLEATGNTTNRPLTLARPVGSKGGRIYYSSYHTADECPSRGFWPQERVLQYLIFDSF